LNTRMMNNLISHECARIYTNRMMQDTRCKMHDKVFTCILYLASCIRSSFVLLNQWLNAKILLIGFVAAFLLLASSCRQKMAQQPRYQPFEPSSFFDDGTSARPLMPGTVPRSYKNDEQFYTGKLNGSLVDTFPFPITEEVMKRGQERFNIFCSPCHSRLGDGQGMIVKRGFMSPPSFHSERLRKAPIGHFFDVITNGYGAMHSYASRVPPKDRWAIIAYIRALQLSQNATIADVPEGEINKGLKK
jgi:hypothetical protein